MLIDFEKAVDSLSWTFLYKILSFFNFNQNFIIWIKTLNKNVTASVLQCGHFSNPIVRWCRQRDPIAPQLFILSAQILTLMINVNENIKGIIIDGKEFRLTQFADDITLILNGTIDSLLASLNTLEFTLLGITFSTEINDMEELNISPILQIITSEIYRWSIKDGSPL